jgi:hypothetical protein
MQPFDYKKGAIYRSSILTTVIDATLSGVPMIDGLSSWVGGDTVPSWKHLLLPGLSFTLGMLELQAIISFHLIITNINFQPFHLYNLRKVIPLLHNFQHKQMHAQTKHILPRRPAVSATAFVFLSII